MRDRELGLREREGGGGWRTQGGRWAAIICAEGGAGSLGA